MKLMPHLKKGLNLFIKDGKMMIISFLILPMVLALVYGGMQKNLFEGKEQSIEAVKVDFQYNENSEKGSILKQILVQDKIKEFLILGKTGAEYTVIINDDFGAVEIKGKDEGTVQLVALKNFVQAVLNKFSDYEIAQKTVSKLNIDENSKQELINNIMASIAQNNEGLLVKENIVEGYKTLSALEYYTISIFSFTTIIMITTLAGNFYKEIKQGTVKRALSTPNSKRDFFLGFIFITFIITIVISTLYVLINRMRGIAFLGNPFYTALIILSHSFLTSAVVGLVVAFIKKELTATLLMNFLLVVPSIFGGVYFNNELIGPKVLKTIMNMAPNTLILNSYKDLSITGSLGAIQGEVITMVVLAAAFFTIAIVKVQKKWEV